MRRLILESGLEELRGDVLAVPERTIVNFTVEGAKKALLSSRIIVFGRDLGTVESFLHPK